MASEELKTVPVPYDSLITAAAERHLDTKTRKAVVLLRCIAIFPYTDTERCMHTFGAYI
jgi:hypothetical protein